MQDDIPWYDGNIKIYYEWHSTSNGAQLDHRDKMAISSLVLELSKMKRDIVIVCELDHNGRITSVSYGLHYWDSHKDFIRIEYRNMNMSKEDALIHQCKSIDLPRLESIYLIHPLESFEAIVTCLKNKKLPVFKDVYLVPAESENFSTENLLFLLQTIDSGFVDKVTDLNIFNVDFTSNQLGTLFVEILPKFSSLSHLYIWSQRNAMSVDHFQAIVERVIEYEKAGKIFSSIPLRVLDMDSKLIVQNLEKNPNAQGVLLAFLRIFDTVWYVGDNPRLLRGNYPVINYALISNFVGRSLVGGYHHVSHRPTLPSSMWPLVLEKAQRPDTHSYYRGWQRNEIMTGLYYLLREGPALLVDTVATSAPTEGVKKRKAESDHTDVQLLQSKHHCRNQAH
jgi:hypothetical protein